MIRLGISGMGEMGRTLFRAAFSHPQFEVKALAHPTTPEALAYLIRYDTIYRKFPEPIRGEKEALITSQGTIHFFSTDQAGEIPWGDVGVDVVIDATEKFRTFDSLQKHIEQGGAKRVVVTVPPQVGETFPFFIRGILDKELKEQRPSIFSTGSATAHCFLPVVKILDSHFGFHSLFATVVRAYTSEQQLLDTPSEDLRLSRAAAQNIIPSRTWSVIAAQKLFPHLSIDGLSMEVPVPDGSAIDVVAFLSKKTTLEEVLSVFEKAQKEWEGILEYCKDPIVSTDVINNPHSCIFDSLATSFLEGNLFKCLVWYDNFFSYSQRILEMIQMVEEE